MTQNLKKFAKKLPCVLHRHTEDRGVRVILIFNNMQDLAVYDCPFLSEHPVDFLAYKMPVFTLLVCNTFFLVWIMVVSILQ